MILWLFICILTVYDRAIIDLSQTSLFEFFLSSLQTEILELAASSAGCKDCDLSAFRDPY